MGRGDLRGRHDGWHAVDEPFKPSTTLWEPVSSARIASLLQLMELALLLTCQLRPWWPTCCVSAPNTRGPIIGRGRKVCLHAVLPLLLCFFLRTLRFLRFKGAGRRSCTVVGCGVGFTGHFALQPSYPGSGSCIEKVLVASGWGWPKGKGRPDARSGDLRFLAHPR